MNGLAKKGADGGETDGPERHGASSVGDQKNGVKS